MDLRSETFAAEKLRELRERWQARQAVGELLADVQGGALGEQIGSTEPRLWTPPLVELTPETSYGFDVVEFARDVLGRPLDPWQEWLVIHAGELTSDGRPRFRIVLVLVARQNGKTELLVVLSLYWLFVEMRQLILGTSSNLDYAKEAWEKAVAHASTNPLLMKDLPDTENQGVRRTNGEISMTLASGPDPLHAPRYKIAAANRRGGRSLTVHRLIMDELREHQNWDAYNAAVPAMNAVRDAQAWALSNQGDDRAMVLDALRTSAMRETDDRLGLFEWSAPEDSIPTDVDALAMSNPNLGLRIDPADLLGQAARAVENGGPELASFKIEIMCMAVRSMDPAVDPMKWGDLLVDGDLDKLRDRIALCLDVSLDMQHAALVACAIQPDGRARLEPVETWSGPGAIRIMKSQLPKLVARIKPQAFGWFPNGPAAGIATSFAERRGGKDAVKWPPSGVEVEEIRQDVAAVCMGFGAEVQAELVVHAGDPFLTTHVLGAEKLHRGDVWVFTRHGPGHVNGAYAAAGALHLARLLPAPRAAVEVA